MINNFVSCLESRDEKHFFIQDGKTTKEPAYIVLEKGEFEVINNTQEPIYFLPTDSCVYDSSDNTRCDCIVYNDDTMCFIELKCIKLKNLTKNRKKAESQLEETIKNFLEEEIIQNKNLEAYTCCNCKISKDDTFEPITRKPKNKEKENYFFENFNTILHCNTKKEFN